MKKILGIFALLVFVCLFTTVLSEGFIKPYNMQNITRWSALFGIISIGVAFVIITGGIDLSIGSVIGLTGCMLPLFLVKYEWTIGSSLLAVLLMSVAIGLINGLLITKLKLQPFVVTLCGLLFYRGFARWWTEDQTQGFGQTYDDGLRLLATGKPCTMATLFMVGGIGLALWSGYRLLRRATAENRMAWFTGLVAGLALAVIGSSRFWYGFEAQSGPELFSVGGFVVRSLNVTVPDVGAGLPQKLMFWGGLAAFVPSGLWFLVTGFSVQPKKVLLPLLALISSAVLFWLTATYLAPNYSTMEQDELYRFGVMKEVSGATLRWIVMMIVFLVVGLLMASVTWLVTAVLNMGGQSARSVFPAVLGSGVIWLLGYTPLAATKVPMPLLIMIALALVSGVFLGQTIYGRYLLALGRNEEAARYSGINTDRMVILAYVICSCLAGLGGVLFALDINSVQPSGHGNFYELYAIAAAVLGGCSLRGGEGTILGVVIGAAVMRVLYNSINILGIPTQLEFAIIGLVILAGVIVDELVKRIVARRRAIAQRDQLE